MRRILILSAILLMAPVAEAVAACQTSDLNGRWAYFDLSTVADQDGIVQFALNADCRFTIDDAVIIAVSCGGGGSDFPADLRGEFLNAEIRLASNCRFEIAGAQFCNYFGQISRDKITGAGVALCGNGFDRLTFDLVKR